MADSLTEPQDEMWVGQEHPKWHVKCVRQSASHRVFLATFSDVQKETDGISLE